MKELSNILWSKGTLTAIGTQSSLAFFEGLTPRKMDRPDGFRFRDFKVDFNPGVPYAEAVSVAKGAVVKFKASDRLILEAPLAHIGPKESFKALPSRGVLIEPDSLLFVTMEFLRGIPEITKDIDITVYLMS